MQALAIRRFIRRPIHHFMRGATARALLAAACAVQLALAGAGAWAGEPQQPGRGVWSFMDEPKDVAYLGPIAIEVDARDVAQRILRVSERMPVRPGPMTLLYPRWLPGDHGATGQISPMSGLKLVAAGKPLAWRRDAVNPNAIHVDIPAGVNELGIGFEFASGSSEQAGAFLLSDTQLDLKWIRLLLYPAGHWDRQITMQPSVRLPAGWQYATALRGAREDAAAGGRIAFDAVSLETLQDSPLFAGRFYRKIPLEAADSTKPVTLHVFADDADGLKASDAQIAAHQQLVVQADRLFRSRHYAHYDFLTHVTAQRHVSGLEHHQSNEIFLLKDYWESWDTHIGNRELLAHEYSHSWNGKFRRPADSWVPHNNLPHRNSLLWVYEGMTQYWGHVLASRAGLTTHAQSRERLGAWSARYVQSAGRAWRPLQDTVHAAQLDSDGEWPSQRRTWDYYSEGALVWLEADLLIRTRSKGQRSLDDVAQALFSVQDGRVAPLLYDFDELVATLERVEPYDWRGFLRTRVDGLSGGRGAVDPEAILLQAGWALTWVPEESEQLRRDSHDNRRVDDFTYSLGLVIGENGDVEEVAWDSAAFKAGLAPHEQVTAVHGLAYARSHLAGAITANQAGAAPIALTIKRGDAYRTVTIDYRGGLRYPRLARLNGVPDLLDEEIYAPRAR